MLVVDGYVNNSPKRKMAKIHIDRKELGASLLMYFDDMQRNNLQCDFNICVGDNCIPVHCEILKWASPYFKAMLRHSTKENHEKRVEMQNVDADCVQVCVDFMYGREIEISEDKYSHLMFVAQMLELTKLCIAIANFWVKHLNPSNVLDLLKITDLYHLPNLRQKCETFTKLCFPVLLGDGALNQIDKTLLKVLMQSKSPKITEKEKLDVLLDWVRHDSSRRTSLSWLLDELDLAKVPKAYRQRLMQYDCLITMDSISTSKFESSMQAPFKLECFIDSYCDVVLFCKSSRNLYLFDPRKKNANASFMNLPKCDVDEYSVAVLDYHIYVLGEDKTVKKLRYWDKDAVWEQMPDMIEEHGMFPPSAVLEGLLYVIGGFGRGYNSNVIERYDPVINKWTLLGQKPAKSDGAALVTLNGSIYSVGGWVNGKATRDLSMLNTFTMKWSIFEPMQDSRAGHAAIALDKDIIVAGGVNEYTSHQSVELYNSMINQWSALTHMNIKRCTFNLVACNGFLFAVGGVGNPFAEKSVEKLDLKTQNWSMANSSLEPFIAVYMSIAVEAT